MVEVNGHDIVIMTCKCPKCGHEFEEEQECEVCIEVDMSDFVPDYP